MRITAGYYFRVFLQLLRADFAVFFINFKDRIFNLFIWLSMTAVIMAYVMPAFGLAADYGVFQLAGLIACAGLFDVMPNVMMLLADFEGSQTISFYLTLPIPSWLVLIKSICYYALTVMITTSCALVMGKLVLWNLFDITKINPWQFVVITAVSGIFYGIWTLWLVSVVKYIVRVRVVWTRFNFPLIFLGGFQFSWYVLYKLYPTVAYLDLLNPMLYVIEGMRGALLGQAGFISFGYCVLALCFFSALLIMHALGRLKKRLDFV